jgi:transposase
MSNVTGFVNELQSVEAEIKNLSKTLKKLRARKKHLESEITEYLKATNKPGIKYKGQAIMLKEVDRRGRRKQSQKEEEIRSVLEQYGVKSNSAVEEVLEAMKGPKTADYKLQIKKI